MLSSRIPGSIGLLGSGYPGLYDFGDTAALRALLLRAENDRRFYGELRRQCARVAPLFRPSLERATWRDLLAEMADLHKVRVRAFIDEPELGALEPNQPVKITWDALPSKTWTGKTETVPKQVVPHQNRSVGELLCAVNNDNLELLPNINVNVRINSRERIGVLSVPRGAVEADGGRRYVFVVRKSQLGVGKSTLEKREIHVGIADATN